MRADEVLEGLAGYADGVVVTTGDGAVVGQAGDVEMEGWRVDLLLGALDAFGDAHGSGPLQLSLLTYAARSIVLVPLREGHGALLIIASPGAAPGMLTAMVRRLMEPSATLEQTA